MRDERTLDSNVWICLKMFKTSIIDIKTAEFIFHEMTTSVILPGEEGEFSILDFHQPIISCLKEGMIKIDEREPIFIKRGIAAVKGNELSILVEE